MLTDRKVRVLTADDPGLVPVEVFSSDMLGPWRLRESVARHDAEYYEAHGDRRAAEASRGAATYAQKRIEEIEAGIVRQSGPK